MSIVLLWTSLDNPLRAAPPSLDYTIGYNNHIGITGWTPLTVSVKSSWPFDGIIEIVTYRGNEFQATLTAIPYRKALHLDAAAEKKIPFTIELIDQLHQPLIRLRSDTTILTERTIDLRRTRTVTQPMVIVVTRSPAHGHCESMPERLTALPVRPSDLPDVWYGYDNVAVAVFDAESIALLGPRQNKALEEWIARGGVSVIMASTNTQALHHARLKNLITVQTTEVHQRKRLPDLERFCGIRPTEATVLTSARCKGCTVLVREDSLPVIQSRALGDGKVLLCAIDLNQPLFSQTENRRRFWQALLPDNSPDMMTPKPQIDDRTVLAAMIDNPPRGFTRFYWALGASCLYLLLLYLCLAAEKIRHNTGWHVRVAMIVSIAASSLVCGVAAFSTDTTSTPSSILLLSKRGGSATAQTQLYTGIFSKRAASTALSYQTDGRLTPIVSPPSTVRTSDPLFIDMPDDGSQTVFLESGNWSMNFFKKRGQTPFHLNAAAVSIPGGYSVTIENGTTHTFDWCALFVNGRVLALDPVAPGNIIAITVDTVASPRDLLIDFSVPDFPGRVWTPHQKKMALALTNSAMGLIHGSIRKRQQARSSSSAGATPSAMNQRFQVMARPLSHCSFCATPPHTTPYGGDDTPMRRSFESSETTKWLPSQILPTESIPAIFYSTVVMALFLFVLWPLKPVSYYFSSNESPQITFLLFSLSLVICCYINLSYGNGEVSVDDYYEEKKNLDIAPLGSFPGYCRDWIVPSLLQPAFLLAAHVPVLLFSCTLSALVAPRFAIGIAILYCCGVGCRQFGFTWYCIFYNRLEIIGYLVCRIIVLVFIVITAMTVQWLNPFLQLFAVTVPTTRTFPAALDTSPLFYCCLLVVAVSVLFGINFYLARYRIHRIRVRRDEQ